VRLFAADMDAMVGFYRDDLGLTITEEINYRGHRCVFLRANTEHHSMELYPGIDYSAFAIDPDGFAFQLYYYMEQIGWDGKPRPAALRPKVDNANWPDAVAAQSDTFLGEPYLGPL